MIIASIIGWWKIFEKAGKRPWMRLIPLFGSYEAYDIADSSSYFILDIILILLGTFARTFFMNCARDACSDYNSYIMTKDAIRFLISAAAIIMTVLHCIASVRLARNFGKDGWFALGLILLPPVFLCILGFGSAKYKGQIITANPKSRTKTDENIAWLKPEEQTNAAKPNTCNTAFPTQRKPAPEPKKDVIIPTVIPTGKVCCYKCGEIQPENRSICWNCGEKLKRNEPSETKMRFTNPDNPAAKNDDQNYECIDNAKETAVLKKEPDHVISEITNADEPSKAADESEAAAAKKPTAKDCLDTIAKSAEPEMKPNDEDPNELLYCRYCGFKLLEHSDFCSHCGRKVR